MNSINCTLLCDGSSDRMLIPAIKWLLIQRFPNSPINIEFADIRRVIRGKKVLAERICIALELFPCDILFLQRDAEKETPEKRLKEIKNAIQQAKCDLPIVVPVVPKKMSEAWLLFNENAIRQAAGNPRGVMDLKLPSIKKVEMLPDPKDVLERAIIKATGLNHRRLKRFNSRYAMHIVAESIEDYSPLRNIPSFQTLENEIGQLNLPGLE